MEKSSKELRLAVLIDADNVPATYVREIMEEVARYGTPTFKRIYADWTGQWVNNWKKVLLENAITPIQQYSYSSGKNASDSALIIDAMDILYTGGVDGFCIVSSDSDFTRLATRLREAGMKVIGMGEQKTLKAFISACDRFVYLEILGENSHPAKGTAKKKNNGRQKNKLPDTNHQDLIRLLSDTIADEADEHGWAFLGSLGRLLLKKKPDFDPRNYGFSKLLPLIKSLPTFETDVRETGTKNVRHIYVRVK